MTDIAPLILHGRHTSLILEPVVQGAPLWRYWGARLPDDITLPPLSAHRPTPSFSLDENIFLSVLPGFGVGWFHQSALLAHRDGRDFAQTITTTEIVEDRACNALSLTLRDTVTALALKLTLTLAPESDVLTIRTHLCNEGAVRLDLQWLAAATLPLPSTADTVHYFSGRHNNEFQPQRAQLGRATWRRENRRGLTSHDTFPGALIALHNTSQHTGLAYGAQLAWSGNNCQTIEWLDDGTFQWQLGEWLAPGEMLLAPGDEYQAPEVLATCSPYGFDGVARNFHTAIRSRLPWPEGGMRPRPVHINTWEGFYFDHDQTALMELAESAAALGIERFVLDDGWFYNRTDDSKALGDWWPDAVKYPEGLYPLAKHITDLGMEFGLWVEPEMVNPDSDLFRAHPDWALQIAGRPLLTARNQLVLNMALEEVQDYLFAAIDTLLRTLPISYLKWDHNRDLTCAGGAGGRASYHAQIRASYTLLERLRTAHPQVEIESCAGGGGRIDAGILQHTHRVWASDCIDAVSRVQIQNGFLNFFPPEIMGAHIGTAPAHSTGRTQAFDFRAAVALTGHLGVELDLRTLNVEETMRLKYWIAFYKQHRESLHQGAVWRGAAGDSLTWQAHGQAQEIASRWLLFITRAQPTELRHMPVVPLPFVDESARYHICQIEPQGAQGAVWHGSWLSHHGLPLPPMKAETVHIYEIQKI